MFTVKVRHADGDEELFTAERIRVRRKGDHFADGIYLDHEDLEPGDTVGMAGDPEGPPVTLEAPATAGQHVILFGSDATEAAKKRKGGQVWVMNAHGATVASYTL